MALRIKMLKKAANALYFGSAAEKKAKANAGRKR